jgi:hypothetical protein
MQESHDASEESRKHLLELKLERLNAIEECRKTEREQRKGQTEQQQDPNESIDKFLERYHSKQQHVTSRLEALKLAANSGDDTQQLKDSLEELASEVLQVSFK